MRKLMAVLAVMFLAGCGGSSSPSSPSPTTPTPAPAPTPDMRIGIVTVSPGGTLTLTPQTSDRCGDLVMAVPYVINNGPIQMRDFDMKISDKYGLEERNIGDFDSGWLEPANRVIRWTTRGCIFGNPGQIVSEGVVNYVTKDGATHQVSWVFSGYTEK